MELNNNLLKNLFFKKYKDAIFNHKHYLNRLSLHNNIISLRDKNKNFQNHVCLSCKYYKNKKLWTNKNILRLYKKFNVHLKLKYNYDDNLLSNTKKETCLQTYLIFLNKIYSSKMFNDFQKLNTILKINDLILVKFFNDYKYLNLVQTNNFFHERKLIKRILS